MNCPTIAGFHFFKFRFALLVVFFALVFTPHISLADILDKFDNIESFYGFDDFALALSMADSLLAMDDLSEPNREKALEWRGRCLAKIGGKLNAEAVDSFVEILQSNPGWRLTSDDRHEQTIYRQAKDEIWRANQALLQEQILDSQEPPTPPSSRNAIISSSVCTASGIAYLLFAKKADDQWSDYINDPNLSEDLYNQYDSTAKKRNIAGGLAIGTGVLSAIFWIKYFVDKKNYVEPSVSLGPFEVISSPQGAFVSLRF